MHLAQGLVPNDVGAAIVNGVTPMKAWRECLGLR